MEVSEQLTHKDREFLYRRLSPLTTGEHWDAFEDFVKDEIAKAIHKFMAKESKECDLGFVMEIRGQISCLYDLLNLKSSVMRRNKPKEE